jgi:prevent-host-death family protein
MRDVIAVGRCVGHRLSEAGRVVGHAMRRVAERTDLYDSYMAELAVSEAREHLAEVIDQARRSGEPIFVTRRGRRVAVIVDSEAFERIVDAAEEATDRRELAAARLEDDYVPWDEVKADLGLV